MVASIKLPPIPLFLGDEDLYLTNFSVALYSPKLNLSYDNIITLFGKFAIDCLITFKTKIGSHVQIKIIRLPPFNFFRYT